MTCRPACGRPLWRASAASHSFSPACPRCTRRCGPRGCCPRNPCETIEVEKMLRNSNAPVLPGRDLAKDFIQGGVKIQVLRAASISVDAGERIAIVGASGTGKTTLLQLLGGLDLLTSGTGALAGSAMNRLNDAERGFLRNKAVGFVYQFHHLLPEFTALENVAMPLLVRRMNPRIAKDLAGRLLTRGGLAARLAHRPSQLSGGERQRAAVARALVTRPRLGLGDEPTGKPHGGNDGQ